jgi:hypothetical protein
MKLLKNFRVSESVKRTGTEITIEDAFSDEVIRVHVLFFQKSFKKQRQTLRLLLWWAIRYYFKILFKR